MNPILLSSLVVVGLAVFIIAGLKVIRRLGAMQHGQVSEPKTQPVENRESLSLGEDAPVIEMSEACLDAEELEDVAEKEVEPDAPQEIVMSVIPKSEPVEDELESMPAYAARAFTPLPEKAEPLFRVAPPSVPDSETPVISKAEVAEAEPESLEETLVADAEPETAEEEAEVEVLAEATVVEVEKKYDFNEVPEEDGFAHALDEVVTNQIEEINSELTLIETLVSEIEQSLADFSSDENFEIEEDAAA